MKLNIRQVCEIKVCQCLRIVIKHKPLYSKSFTIDVVKLPIKFLNMLFPIMLKIDIKHFPFHNVYSI